MNTKEKLVAMLALIGKDPLDTHHDPETFQIRWSCTVGDISQGQMLTGMYAYGWTAESAIDSVWDLIEKLPKDSCLVIHGGKRDERRVRWYGLTWIDVDYIR